MQTKIAAGAGFPQLTVTALNGESVELGKPNGGKDWKMVVVFRGRHCPMCVRYLNLLEEYKQQLNDIGIDVIAVSGDSLEQTQDIMSKLNISFDMTYGLTVEQMKELGLYISHPRSPEETDHPFAEPGLFVVNADGQVQVVDISNNPFVRPEPEVLTNGLAWIRNPENNYPIRGTYV